MAVEDNEINLRIVMDCNGEIENQMSEDWKCIICKRMLINAHSGPCGCRYCLDCITTHLGGSKKYCPGKIRNCREKLLELNSNILYEQAVNIQILNTIVKCTEESCQFKDELRKIKNHIRLCTSISDKCPYFPIGCSGISMTDDQIKEHLQAENHLHSKLILQWMNNFHDEMKSTEVGKSSTNCDDNYMEKEMNSIREEIENKQDIINDLLSKDFDKVRLITQMDQRIQQYETKLDLLERRIEKRPIFPWMIFSFGVVVLLFIVYVMQIKTNSPNVNPVTSVPKERHDQLEYGHFEWQIENFTLLYLKATKEANMNIYSKPFFTHEKGYQISVQLFPNGDRGAEGEYLSIYFNIMMGPFDKFLRWPMDQHIKIELMNQKTGLVHKGGSVNFNSFTKYAETRQPMTERNNGIGFLKFSKLDELFSMYDDIVKDDKLIIICVRR